MVMSTHFTRTPSSFFAALQCGFVEWCFFLFRCLFTCLLFLLLLLLLLISPMILSVSLFTIGSPDCRVYLLLLPLSSSLGFFLCSILPYPPIPIPIPRFFPSLSPSSLSPLSFPHISPSLHLSLSISLSSPSFFFLVRISYYLC